MIISDLKRRDIDSCAFLMKLLKSAKYEIEGSAVGDMHSCYSWVQELSHAMAEGYNLEHMPVAAKAGKAAPSNIKVKNPPPKG